MAKPRQGVLKYLVWHRRVCPALSLHGQPACHPSVTSVLGPGHSLHGHGSHSWERAAFLEAISVRREPLEAALSTEEKTAWTALTEGARLLVSCGATRWWVQVVKARASSPMAGFLQDASDGWAGYQEAVYHPTYILKMYVGR